MGAALIIGIMVSIVTGALAYFCGYRDGKDEATNAALDLINEKRERLGIDG